ncbi:MFS transporter [Allostreptomyces psammosilenae]|uniref:MFS family permease n=1 Tax=Allostreptomyces psammosilenae TaxID=1892865 RepID=A0A853A8S7_9ACTN|nr:MFS transporter [Allostreptomyces psammosilenae]NYI06928.1 MFS family permease [Allostreptomyces psammosilenae]
MELAAEPSPTQPPSPEPAPPPASPAVSPAASPPEPSTAPAAREAGPTVVLVAVLLAVAVVPMSISGTGVALPRIGDDTGASLPALQWVVNAFNLAFACLTLAWGSLADIIGRVRAFALGAAVFAAASLASAATSDIVLLDIARAVAGVGGAAILSSGSALLAGVFHGAARTRAFALFGTVAGIALALGPTVSGQLVQTLGWRWIFVLHALALLVVLALTPAVARRDTSVPRGGRVDLAGTALFVASLAVAMTAIVQASRWGWGSAATLGMLGVSLLLLAAFAAVERRVTAPMLDLAVLRNRRFLGVCLVPVAGSFGFVTLLTYLPTYLTTVTERDSATAGWVMLLLTSPVLLCPVLAGRLVTAGVPSTALLLGSLVCLVAGDAALLLSGPEVTTALLAVPLLLVGVGFGLAAGLVDAQALEMVPTHQAGMAAGFLNTLRLGSEAVAVAVYASLLATLIRVRITDGVAADSAGANVPTGADPAALAEHAAAGDVAGATADGGTTAELTRLLVSGYDGAFHTMAWLLAAVCAALTVLIAVLLRPERPARP